MAFGARLCPGCAVPIVGTAYGCEWCCHKTINESGMGDVAWHSMSVDDRAHLIAQTMVKQVVIHRDGHKVREWNVGAVRDCYEVSDSGMLSAAQGTGKPRDPRGYGRFPELVPSAKRATEPPFELGST